jgi:hypothetical protein
MAAEPTPHENLTSEEMSQIKLWVQTWRKAGPALERIRREELRNLDGAKAIALLCGPADYTMPPRAPKATSGLVEQQYWFMKEACRLGLFPLEIREKT